MNLKKKWLGRPITGLFSTGKSNSVVHRGAMRGRSKMVVFSVSLSESCNLNCGYCDVDKKSKKKISSALFLEGYHQKRKKFPGEVIRVDFHGGEPLLQWSLIQEIVHGLKNEKDCQFFMATNGLLLNQKKIDFLNKHNFTVSLSFDGLWQDQNRKQHNGLGTLEIYLKKRELLGGINHLECHSMIYRGNYNLLENHLFIRDNFGLNAGLTLVRDVGVWSFEDAERFNRGFTELVDWYIENVDGDEVPGLILSYLQHFLRYLMKGLEVENCGAGASYFSFTEDETLPCNRFQEKKYMEKIPEFVKMKECRGCEAEKYCRKGCLFENIKNNGPIVEICEMYKHMYREVSRMTRVLQKNTVFRDLIMGEMHDA